MPLRARRPCYTCAPSPYPAIVLRHRALDPPTPLLLRRRHPVGPPTPAAPPFQLSSLRRRRPCCSVAAKYSSGSGEVNRGKEIPILCSLTVTKICFLCNEGGGTEFALLHAQSAQLCVQHHPVAICSQFVEKRHRSCIYTFEGEKNRGRTYLDDPRSELLLPVPWCGGCAIKRAS